MTRTEPDDLPADYGVDEQAETLAEGEPPADWDTDPNPPPLELDRASFRDLPEEERRALRSPEPLEGEVVPGVQADRVLDRTDLPAVFDSIAQSLADGIVVDDLDAYSKGLRPALVDAVRERVRLVRADRGTVVTDADVFPLVRQLTAAEEVLRRIGGAWTGAADECRSIAGEELLTAKGEQDGVPQGRLIVPDGTGHEIVVRAKVKRGADTFDVSGIVGVVAEAAARAHAAKGCGCLPYEAGGDGPERDCVVHGDPPVVAAEVARLACHELLGLLSSPKWATTKLDAFARALAAAGHDGDAGVLQQARVKGAETWDGTTEVVREEAKARRRS